VPAFCNADSLRLMICSTAATRRRLQKQRMINAVLWAQGSYEARYPPSAGGFQDVSVALCVTCFRPSHDVPKRTHRIQSPPARFTAVRIHALVKSTDRLCPRICCSKTRFQRILQSLVFHLSLLYPLQARCSRRTIISYHRRCCSCDSRNPTFTTTCPPLPTLHLASSKEDLLEAYLQPPSPCSSSLASSLSLHSSGCASGSCFSTAMDATAAACAARHSSRRLQQSRDCPAQRP
jgi:hypothetical protein